MELPDVAGNPADEMDIAQQVPPEEEEVSDTYTREQVLALIAKYQATTADYLIQTYFEIFKIEDGPLHAKYHRRFSHIVFNNLKEIIRKLIRAVYLPKIPDIIKEDLEHTTYVSCIYPHHLERAPCPLFLQFFNPKYGIEHRRLRYIESSQELGGVLSQYGLVGKIVGYCGDFSYNDPGIPDSQTDDFSSLSASNGRTIRYLPYSDGFIRRLFDILLDYLPENVSVSLTAVGETILRMTPRSQFATTLLQHYKSFLDDKNQPHILLSYYTKFVTDNFAKINSYLEPLHCLPRSIESLLCNVSQRFLLVFMREIYVKVEEIKLLDKHCAVMYYFRLVEIRDLFKMYEGTNFIPPKALACFKKEIDELIQNNTLHPEVDRDKINKLYKDILSVTSKCFTRAVIYIAPLLEQFPDFDNFSWVLLKNPSIDENQVHQTYHVIENTGCADCPTLVQEVKDLNSVLTTMPLLEMQDGVVAKWVAILERCPTVSLVTRLLEYLLALPASVKLLTDSDLKNDCCCSDNITIRFNMGRRTHEEIIENIEGFLGEQFVKASNIIKENQIPVIID